MTSAAAPEPHRLKFHWPQRPQISLPLVGFLFLSVLAHGLAFYILQVVDPPVVAITPPPVHVNLITPWRLTEKGVVPDLDNQALLRWIDLEDPFAIANPHEIVPVNLYDPSYQRSLAETRATPKSPDENATDVPFPAAQDIVEVMGGAQESPSKTAPGLLPLPTELRFSGQLTGRKIIKQPPLKFNTAGAGSREPVSFMVGVGPDGKVLYTFFMGVEMDDKAKTIDQKAEDYLGSVEFSREAGDVVWGVATYYWGNDTYKAGQAETAKP